jgi:GDP-L-fucose synthase
MPTNLYGANDNYHLQNAHVLPALIRKFHEAKINGLDEVIVWGVVSQKENFYMPMIVQMLPVSNE